MLGKDDGYGGPEFDQFLGGPGEDWFWGRGGNDQFSDESGISHIWLGPGNDLAFFDPHQQCHHQIRSTAAQAETTYSS